MTAMPTRYLSLGLCSVTLRTSFDRGGGRGGGARRGWSASSGAPTCTSRRAIWRRAAGARGDGRAGLRVASYGSYWRCAGDFAPVLASARELGAPRVRIWAGEVGSRDVTRAQRDAIAAARARGGRPPRPRATALADRSTRVRAPRRHAHRRHRLRARARRGDRRAVLLAAAAGHARRRRRSTGCGVSADVPAVHVFSWWPGSTRLRLRERAALWRAVFAELHAPATRCSSSCPATIRRWSRRRRRHVARCCRPDDAAGPARAAVRRRSGSRAVADVVRARAGRGRAQRLGLSAARRGAAGARAGAARDRARRRRRQGPCHRRVLGPRAARLDRGGRERRAGRRVHARAHPAGGQGGRPDGARVPRAPRRDRPDQRVPGRRQPRQDGRDRRRVADRPARDRAAGAVRPARARQRPLRRGQRRARRAAGGAATSSACTRRRSPRPATCSTPAGSRCCATARR